MAATELQTTGSGLRNSPPLRPYGVWLVIISATLAVASVILAATGGRETRKYLVAAWTVLPPWFFASELYFARKKHRDTHSLADLREDQQMAQKIWAGLVTALTALYLKA